ncbi:YjcZ family sporulation protein [Halalkalibacter alkaliphilus]|uniref:YjcZ family sporulation protein n=1 Tax=Halalkalibacter alkaliphilus TaxID=2917993 RepID=A0A9X2CW11_9BACI|nr:YjcZ family sporulation protein [Halalkalibacter alkaliphilus]MCL7749396.1 YjcZ family sporulation protein [Halalkalibacter alkaliphilus]
MTEGFSLIVVLFILLVIVGASWFVPEYTTAAPTYGYGYDCGC